LSLPQQAAHFSFQELLHMRRALLCLLFSAALFTSRSWGQQPSDQAASEAAIRKAADSYVEAFNKHDAQALADQWSPDAVYLNRTTGEEAIGRAAIAEQFATLFKEQPELKLEVTVASVQFVSPNVAIEQGTAKLLSPKAEPEEIEYSAVNVKRDGKWLLDRVTDKSKEVTAGRLRHSRQSGITGAYQFAASAGLVTGARIGVGQEVCRAPCFSSDRGPFR
jgi:uncharacterized protein (TIGR02246 family)